MKTTRSTPYAEFAQYMKTVVQEGLREAEKKLPAPSLNNSAPETEDFFRHCWKFIDTVRETHIFQEKLAAGDLTAEICPSNRLAAPAKELQTTLKHLTWQTEQIAKGDMNQRFQSLGDFSESLNSLIDRLKIRSELERKIIVNENRLKTITSVLGDGVIVLDGKGTVTFCNPEACNLLQMNEQTLLGSSFHQTVHTQHADGRKITASDKFTVNTLKSKTIFRSDDLSFTQQRGSVVPVSVACSPIIDNGKATGVVISFRDITEQKNYLESLEYINKVLEKQAMTDALTDLYNRQYFNDRLRQELASSKRYSTPVSLIMFDIDSFKKVNDRFGHISGDNVLKDISRLILSNIRESDIFARWGGEEFVVLATQIGKDSAVVFAEKLRVLIETHSFPIDRQVTCSFGVTEFTATDNSGDFINRADVALYKAKKSGRNKVVAL